jgi:PLP dependent protein
MSIKTEAYKNIISELQQKNVALVAVSKTKPAEDILALYELGQRDFGENYVQELIDKQSILPRDIRWHFIGHLQSNKVKMMASFVHLIHGIDSFKLLKEINKEAQKNQRIISCLLQIHIAQEETKFGLNAEELDQTIREFNNSKMQNVNIIGLMGMASFTDDENIIRSEFQNLEKLFNKYPQLSTLSMGMSSDYKIAVAEGSTMVRIGSLLFGERK